MVWSAQAYAHIEIVPPGAGNLHWYNIYISGEITPGMENELRKMSRGIGRKGAVVSLDSPGGNLMEGIKIGRYIRDNGWQTRVHSKNETSKAICASSCVFIFAGGDHRSIGDGAKLGVHRFSSPRRSPDDLALGQYITGTLLEYLRTTTVSTSLIDRASKVPPNEIAWLTEEELDQFNLRTAGVATWSLDAEEIGFTLSGTIDSLVDGGMVTLTCDGGLILFFGGYWTRTEPMQPVSKWTHISFNVGNGTQMQRVPFVGMLNSEADMIVGGKFYLNELHIKAFPTADKIFLNIISVSNHDVHGKPRAVTTNRVVQINIGRNDRHKIVKFLRACMPNS